MHKVVEILQERIDECDGKISLAIRLADYVAASQRDHHRKGLQRALCVVEQVMDKKFITGRSEKTE